MFVPVAMHCMPASPPQAVAATQQLMLREVAITRRSASMPSNVKMPPQIPSAQEQLMQKESAGMRQFVMPKALPAIAEGIYIQYVKNAFGTGTQHG